MTVVSVDYHYVFSPQGEAGQPGVPGESVSFFDYMCTLQQWFTVFSDD